MEIPFENPCPGQAKGLSAYYFTQAVHMLLASHCMLGNPEDYPRDFKNFDNETGDFDFIIVGGGSAGSVLASRLSEIKKWRILLIEAGDNPTFESDIPGFCLSLPGRDLDWKFTTKKSEKCCLGMEDETCAIFQGKVLGGTSSINKMHYLRGSIDDYNEWENLGNVGWKHEEVLKYFKKSEKLEDDFTIIKDSDYEKIFETFKKNAGNNERKIYELSKLVSGKYHSKAGLLSVNHFAYDVNLSRMKNSICAGAEELGIPWLADINGRSQRGFVRVMGAIQEGSRGNSAKLFLTPIKDRKNLIVLKNTTVLQLIVEGKRVTGVKFLRNGSIKKASAKKEVILSAGAINSPRLLMLSGIGPAEHLEKIGVKVIKNLPGVGKNLQAHLSFFGLPFTVNGTDPKPLSHLDKIDAMYRFISRGTGFFGNIGLNEIVGFVGTEHNNSSSDIQFLFYLNRVRDYYTLNELLTSLKIKNEIRDQFARAYSTSNLLIVCPTLIKPESKGTVELTGPHFSNPPLIDYNFFQNKNDVATLIKGIKIGIQLTQTRALKNFRPELLKLDFSGCRKEDFNTDEYWECLTRYMTSTMNDVGGTCKMGPEKDPFAVVDNTLKVYGIEGLRVVDSSIMPKIIRGSTSIASGMIAEKISDLIKKNWNNIKHEEL